MEFQQNIKNNEQKIQTIIVMAIRLLSMTCAETMRT